MCINPKNPDEPGLLSNQGEKRRHLYFIRVPLRKKVLKSGTPSPGTLAVNTKFFGRKTVKTAHQSPVKPS